MGINISKSSGASAPLTLTSPTANQVPLTVEGAASPTVDAIDIWYDNTTKKPGIIVTKNGQVKLGIYRTEFSFQ